MVDFLVSLVEGVEEGQEECLKKIPFLSSLLVLKSVEKLTDCHQYHCCHSSSIEAPIVF